MKEVQIKSICIVGSGHVGLVTGACLAELGDRVICMDDDFKKIESLASGVVPFYEPGLEELVHRNTKSGRLSFTSNLGEGVKQAEIIFVYCSHVLEHVDDPLRACEEIMRIGKQGYIETPTMGKDSLFGWARGMHKWHVVAIGQNLCFFEYSQRQLDRMKPLAWKNIIFSQWYNPIQEAFYQNQDLFNVMFTWFDSFDVFVFHLDGTVEALNADVRCNELPYPQH